VSDAEVTEQDLETARASYDRCCQTRGFPEGFYTHFFSRCAAAEPMFAHTDFTRQVKLLRHAIGSLLIFPKHGKSEPNLLTRVADRHGRGDLAVDPALYPQFVDALIDTVRDHDVQFGPAIERAWRATVAPGIAYMQSKY